MSMKRVIEVLKEHGPMTPAEMMKYITGVTKKTIDNDCLELKNKGLATRDSEGKLHLREGITPETPETGELEAKDEEEGNNMDDTKEKEKPEGESKEGKPLDPKAQFSELVSSTGVDKKIVPTITNLVFNGNWDSLDWLKQVLLRNARGFVSEPQARMIITSWSQIRGLPYNPEDFPLEEPEKGRATKTAEKEPPKPLVARIAEDTGLGYKVVKDKDGDWVAVPGGPLTYEVALEKVERLNAIKAMGAGQPAEVPEAPEEGGEGKPSVKGTKKSESLQDYFMRKIIDDFIDGRKGRGDEESPVLKELRDELRQSRQEIQNMKEAQDRDWRERMEANLAAIAARDPWSDPAELAKARQLLGIPSSAVTDSSPAVQLIKDATQKMDKQADRLTGLVERFVLKSDEFRPEEKRTTEEKEAKAGALLDEVSRRQRSKEIGKRAFGQ
jgi:hypothetical protein